jgi:hypothetical protein
MQGVTLCAAIACAVSAGNIARYQAEQNEIEEIKTRAITADVVDEIATSAYISQQQRQQEAEQILNPREHLERSLALTYDGEEESEPLAQNQLAELNRTTLRTPNQNALNERCNSKQRAGAKPRSSSKCGECPKVEAQNIKLLRLSTSAWLRSHPSHSCREILLETLRVSRVISLLARSKIAQFNLEFAFSRIRS